MKPFLHNKRLLAQEAVTKARIYHFLSLLVLLDCSLQNK